MKTITFLKSIGVFALLLALTAPALAQGQPPPRVDVLIGFVSPPVPEDVAIVRAVGGRVRYVYSIVPAMAASVPEPALRGLARDRRVRVIEPDGLFHAIAHDETSTDTELNNTWGVKHIQSGAAHIAGSLGAGVRVAVIDSGIDYDHPEFAAAYMGGYNFVGGNHFPFDENGHGTHVAGTVAAAKNGAGVVGVAPAVELYALKVLGANGSGSFSDVIAALNWCVVNQIRISNNSYGSSMNPGSIVQNAFDNSAAAGVLHIAAAGNAGNPGGKGNNVGYPARYASVVAVAATTQNDTRASFSSTGPDVELSAPGVGIRSTVPGGGYASYNGTSMASPHVAGVAALVMAADDGLTAATVRQVLRDTAKPLGSANQYGHGLVQAKAAVDAGAESDGKSESGEDSTPGGDSGTATVSSITYSGSGGPTGDKHLHTTVTVEDDNGSAVSGATVSITLFHASTGNSWLATGTTGSGGTATFSLNNAPSGCYTTEVTGLTASGLIWDNETPPNEDCK